MKGKFATKKDYAARLSFIFDGEIKKPSRQAKVNRIQQHQTNFTTNAKRTSLGRNQGRGKRPTENKPRTIKKMVIGSFILIITLNVNGLNAPTKRHRLAERMKTCTYALPLTASLSLTAPLKLCVVTLYC